MKTQSKYATRWLEKLLTPVKLSNYILPIGKIKHRRAVIYARVSTKGQEKHLPEQVREVKNELEKRGIEVVETFSEVASAVDVIYAEESRGRHQLFRAILKAMRNDCAVVAESLDRFRRSWMSKGDKEKHGQRSLDIFDVETLMDEAEGVQLATIVHPDSPPDKGETRSYQTKRGQSEKGRKGGRPKKEKQTPKERREKLMPLARWLSNDGLSYRGIENELGVSFSTVRDWIKKAKTAHLIMRSKTS